MTGWLTAGAATLELLGIGRVSDGLGDTLDAAGLGRCVVALVVGEERAAELSWVGETTAEGDAEG